MKMNALAAVLIALVALIACGPIVIGGGITGSGASETRTFDYTGFTRLDVGSAIPVEVTRADQFGISVTADNNLWPYVIVSKSGDTLRITLESGHSYLNTHIRAKVSMPALSAMDLSGAVSGTITGFSSESDFQGTLSGASKLTGDLTAGDVTLRLSGASSVTLTGSGTSLDANASGASSLNLDGFKVTNAEVTMTGASHGSLDVTGRLDVSLSGASSLQYSGNPTLGRQNISGASSLRSR
jgi:hypothetical protein